MATIADKELLAYAERYGLSPESIGFGEDKPAIDDNRGISMRS